MSRSISYVNLPGIALVALGGAIGGFIGFGAHSRIHTAKLLELSQDLPIVIEIVDAAEKMQSAIRNPQSTILSQACLTSGLRARK